MSHTQRDPPQAPFRGNPRDDETIWSMNDDLAGLTVGGSTTAGIGGLSLGEEFDGETQPPLYEFDDETNPSVDPKVKKTEKKSNVGRRVSVDPDGFSSVDSSADLPRYPRVPSPRVKPPRAPTPPPARKPPTPSPQDDDKDMAEVKALIRDGLIEALGIDPSQAKEKEEEKKKAAQPKTYLPSGVAIRSTARDPADMGTTKVQITRIDRKNDGSSTQSKLRARWCTPLKHDFATPDYAKIFSSDSAEDLASLAIGIQDSLEEFKKWCVATDTLHIFKIPLNVSDFSDIRSISTASAKCLLTNFNDISLLDAKSYQAFINLNCDDSETLCSNWCLEKLTNSTELTLRRRVLQIHDKLPEAQQGGITYFKLLAQECYKSSYQARKGLQTWLEGFDLRNFDNEDVRAATTKFKAVVDLLGEEVPSDHVRYYLKGMQQASCEDFKRMADTQFGFYGTTPYQMWKQAFGGDRAELDAFGETFLTEYNSLTQGSKWSGFGHSASSFKASITGTTAATATDLSDKKEDYTNMNSFQRWWKSETCQRKHCGGNHPTKYHDNLELFDRPRSRPGNRDRDRRNRARNKSTDRKSDGQKSSRPQPRFKSDAHRKKYEKYIHKAALECVEEDDQELFAHLAGNVSESDSDSKGNDSDSDGEASAADEHANAAAISLDMLLN